MRQKVVVNVPAKKWVGRGWVITTVLVSAILTLIFGTVSPLMSSAEVTIFLLLFGLIIALFVATVFAYYRTTYVIRDRVLHSWSTFMVIRLPLKDIKKVELTRVPVHMRVGAALYSGFFYIPNVGWTRSIITNLNDGLLIYAKGGKKYLITPSHPDKFMKLLKR